MDVLLATGEQVTIALLAMTLIAAGVPARSMTGQQAQVRTDSAHTQGPHRRGGHRGDPRRARGGQGGDRGRVPGGGPRGQHHHPGPGRVGHERGGGGGGPQGGRLRDLHRRGRGVHHRPERLRPGPQARPHLLRRDARTGQRGRQGPADPLGRVRQEVQGSRSTCAPRSTTTRAPGSWRRTRRWNRWWCPGSPTTATRPRSACGGCPTGPASPPRSSAASAAKNIVVDMIVQDVGEEGHASMTFTVPQGGPEARADGHRAGGPRARGDRGHVRTWASPRSPSSAWACAATPGWPPSMFEVLATRGDQRPDDLHLGDQGLLRDRGEVHRVGGARAPRRLRALEKERGP